MAMNEFYIKCTRIASGGGVALPPRSASVDS